MNIEDKLTRIPIITPLIRLLQSTRFLVFVATAISAVLVSLEPAFGRMQDEVVIIIAACGIVVITGRTLDDALTIIGAHRESIPNFQTPKEAAEYLLPILLEGLGINGSNQALEPSEKVLATPDQLKNLTPAEVNQLRALHAKLNASVGNVAG